MSSSVSKAGTALTSEQSTKVVAAIKTITPVISDDLKNKIIKYMEKNTSDWSSVIDNQTALVEKIKKYQTEVEKPFYKNMTYVYGAAVAVAVLGIGGYIYYKKRPNPNRNRMN